VGNILSAFRPQELFLTFYPLPVAAREAGYDCVSFAGPGYVFAAVKPANPATGPFFCVEFLNHFLKDPADRVPE
jgi:hypothetical protein